MDYQTGKFYSHNVSDVISRYDAIDSPISKYFSLAFPKPASQILDVGCGTGRDLRALLAAGYNAFGIEPVEELRQAAIQRYPSLSGCLRSGALPGFSVDDKYDGILCSAVLMHIPQGQQLEAFLDIRNLLKVGGRLLLSIPATRDDLDEEFRDPDGRLFVPTDPERIRLIAEQIGFTFISHSNDEDALGRSGYSWNTLIFEKSSEANRPLDRIESVLRNDRKVATYKLALLRAFCDIAERDENAVTWFPDGYVGMPMEALAECWLAYYWPLISASEHIPQSTTDHPGSRRAITFRAALSDLNCLCRDYFDPDPDVAYTLFVLAWKKGTLTNDIARQLRAVLSAIKTALRDGPVKHAAQGGMFRYQSGLVMLHVDLWREFCLSSHWIRDSLILRWSELCEKFSMSKDPSIQRGATLSYLLKEGLPEREQGIARRMYEERENLSCVWSDKKITLATMDVDHALPFSLWRNNDLWNLLPAARTVNNEKRDKIPTPELLRSRKEAIVDVWQFANEIEPKVFQFEVERTLGKFHESRWEQELFQYMSERAAVAIYRRGETAWNYGL